MNCGATINELILYPTLPATFPERITSGIKIIFSRLYKLVQKKLLYATKTIIIVNKKVYNDFKFSLGSNFKFFNLEKIKNNRFINKPAYPADENVITIQKIHRREIKILFLLLENVKFKNIIK